MNEEDWLEYWFKTTISDIQELTYYEEHWDVKSKKYRSLLKKAKKDTDFFIQLLGVKRSDILNKLEQINKIEVNEAVK